MNFKALVTMTMCLTRIQNEKLQVDIKTVAWFHSGSSIWKTVTKKHI